jgi:hypothetical protein
MSRWASTSSQLRTRSNTQERGSATWSSNSNSNNPRRSGGPTTVGLGLIPTSSNEPEASLGEDPHERYLVSNSIFTASKTFHETKQKFAKFKKSIKICITKIK